ncbi:hypothetical protein TNIN_354581 [Trichonephila inaurata madagascariensis]|uniref:Uncharacterized protein n=1 Tax=Trichonephila inaurata madagascariensis TaxID=2747483 RepID=A0A8X6XVI1_9ARAC|nr:hypothetical protein TNIN_354581 [Trichonephila inaurata madagascariensis]
MTYKPSLWHNEHDAWNDKILRIGFCYIFEELPSDDDSAASEKSDTNDEDYVENVAQGENISSDDEEIDEIQCPSISQPEIKWG